MLEDGHIPTSIDIGYVPTDISKEWLDNVISSTISPRLKHVYINQVELHQTHPGRVIYVIEIPQATTHAPHQALDKLYYKRFNFDSVPMADYEVKDEFKMSNNLSERPFPPEGQRIEYKLTLTRPEILARVIASFANTEGGKIIIGIDDGGNIVGLSDETITKAPRLVEQALQLLQPQPPLISQIEKINGKKLFVIEVQNYQAPIITEDQRYYIRKGASNVLMEEDLIAGLVTAVPGLKPNVLKSFSLKDNDTLRSDNINRFTKIVHEEIEETTDITKIYTILLEPIRRTRDETSTQINECRWQKRITFLVALIFLIIAIVLVAIGTLFIYFGHLQGGVVSTASSILSTIVSGLAFTFNKQTNDRNDTFYKELVTLERSYAIIECIPLITDIQMRNETLRDLIKNNFSEKR